MPITQDRILTLVKITDELNFHHEKLREFISREARLATEEYHKNTDLAYLSSTLLGRIQAIESITLEPHLNPEYIETLAREKEHFRLTKSRNDRLRLKAQRKRKGSPNYVD